MTKHDLPVWRWDNMYAYVSITVSVIFTILFNYFLLIGDIREIKQDLKYIVKKQDELGSDFSGWKKQFEGRLGVNEIKIAAVEARLQIK